MKQNEKTGGAAEMKYMGKKKGQCYVCSSHPRVEQSMYVSCKLYLLSSR